MRESESNSYMEQLLSDIREYTQVLDNYAIDDKYTPQEGRSLGCWEENQASLEKAREVTKKISADKNIQIETRIVHSTSKKADGTTVNTFYLVY